MGFGKWLIGGACTVGAIVAAPIVLPMAAAGAMAAAGVVAASTVGTATAGAMAAVGSTVGAAAGAVGITSVAAVAGTATGAAAVGTISTAGVVGIATTTSGAKKMYDAKEIVDIAESRYNVKKQQVDKIEEKANNKLQILGKIKIETWKEFQDFYTVITKIKNCNILKGEAKNESFKISKEELDNLNMLSFKANELLSTSAGSIGAGAITGLGVYGGTMAIGTASTGTAIAGLSGVASTNATLAALGGGALNVGGLGMAGGTAVLGGLVAAPALAVAGIFIAAKGNNSLDKAYEISIKADEAIIKLDSSIKLIEEIDNTVNSVSNELRVLGDTFKKKLKELKDIVSIERDFRNFTDEQIKVTETNILIVKILKKLTTTDLLVKKGEEQAINTYEINIAVSEAEDINNQF